MELFLVKGGQLILSLSLLIVLHELGHFIPAKLFKTRVEKFYLFFDVKFSLFKKKIGETVYGIGWLPLGGYVKISGMIDESMDTEQMAQPAQPWEFRAKPTWQRLIIMLGGVTVNLVLGFLIYMMVMFVWGRTVITNDALVYGLSPTPQAQAIGFEQGDKVLTVNGVPLDAAMDVNRWLLLRDANSITVAHANGKTETLTIPEDFGKQLFAAGEMFPLIPHMPAIIEKVKENSAAAVAGILPNDRIVGVNDVTIASMPQMQSALDDLKGEEVVLTVLRNGKTQQITTSVTEDGTVGVYLKDTRPQTTDVSYSAAESIKQGFDYGYWTLFDYVAGFKFIFTKKGASQLGGFGTIGSLFPAKWDWRIFWERTALISIILAFMNVLPIPALDGGHVVFLTYEMLTGRKPHQKVLEYAQMVGLILLLALFVYANGNDIYRFLLK
ncbi:MAG: RIP metalloprotease RseP [Flavobacteriaceae bacterium]